MSDELNQFHAELPDEQYQEGFADKLAKQSYEFTLSHAMERIDKLERERDELSELLSEIHRSTGTGTDGEWARDNAHRISAISLTWDNKETLRDCHKCGGKLEPDHTCANFYCPNFTFTWPKNPI